MLLTTFSCQRKEGYELTKSETKQNIQINFSYSPFSLDPRKYTDPVSTTLNFMLYEGLTRLEADGTISMALAKSVKVSDDLKTYVFYLRKCSWSDGTPITAYDFEASWKRALSPEFTSRSSHLLFPIKNGKKAKFGKCSLDEVGVKAIDNRTLLVELRKPTPYFLELTAFCAYFPVPDEGKDVPLTVRDQNLKVSGPFQVSSWANEVKIKVQKNPNYWNASEVQLDEIQITIISDEGTALKMYEKGKQDWIGGLISPIPLDAISNLKQLRQLRQWPIAGTTLSTFNVHVYPFNNINIRKAFAYAVNREALTENVSQMFDDIATGPVPLTLKKATSPPLFPDHAEELSRKHFAIGLKELGITREEFPTVTYNYFSSELQRNLALSLQNVWKRVLGVNIKLECNELKTHLHKLYNRDFQYAQMSWIGQYHDQMSFLERFVTKDSFRNYSGWESQQFKKLIADSFYQEGEARMELLSQAELVVADEMPIIPLYHFHVVYVKNPRLKSVLISPMGDVQFHKAYLEH